MQEEILRKIQFDYEKKKGVKDRYKKIKKRILELEEDEKVKEYLSLLNELDTIDYIKNVELIDEDLLVNTLYEYIKKIKETNNIMIYLGTYMTSSECDIEHGPQDILVSRNDPHADFRTYVDLEKHMIDAVNIPIGDCAMYESSHTIIYPGTLLYRQKYYELQREFIKDAITMGQDQAVVKILNKYNCK